ncbi:hypothetical protein [Bernardetia sp.]|uniref:hypothetical protein n=1 Tax=Bernardetia sp. TaxID=1937974 RepID=UPI0025C6D18B|nr:hypothetical protein [Bernardetia sp.]
MAILKLKEKEFLKDLTMKHYFTLLFTKKIIRFLTLLLILLVAMPAIDVPQAEAQTKKTGNFFTRRFKRKNKFQRKSKSSTAFQRKPFKCSEVGKQKVKQLKVSKKQLRRWEEERLVKAEQERLREQRQARVTEKKEEVVLTASTDNDISQVAKKEHEKVKKTEQKEESTPKGWYSSETPDAPKVPPFLFNQKNEIENQRSREEVETVAKYSRLGYLIVLKSSNEKQLQKAKEYLISLGAEKENIKLDSSVSDKENQVEIKIEK